MVVYNAATRELTAKIVYYGPGLGGKTTNLQLLHDRLEPSTVGKLLNLATHTDRTIYFDLLPVELGDIKGYKIRFQLATVPGQTAFNETRRVVLRGADGIVFVADSQWTMLPKNLESWQNLKDNLKVNEVSFESLPIVIQYNKRDLPEILSVDAMQEALGLSSYPFAEAVASAGRGVTETFKLISKLTFVDLLRRLQGRKPEVPRASVAPRREPDDLQSWKDSLLNRTSPLTAPPSHTAAPPAPEEAPFEMEELPLPDAETQAGAPFGGPAEADPGLTSAGMPEPPAAEALRTQAFALPLDARATESSPLASGEGMGRDTPESLDLEPPERLPEAVEFVEETPGREAERAPLAGPLGSEPERPEILSDAERPTRVLATATAPPVSTPEAILAAEQERLRALESRLAEREARAGQEREESSRAREETNALTVRLEAFERDARALGKSLREQIDQLALRLPAIEEAAARASEAEARIRVLDERLGEEAKRQRTAEDDVSMALKSLHERGEKLDQQLGALSSQLSALETALQERSAEGRRMAEDLRRELDSLATAFAERTGQRNREAEELRQRMEMLAKALEEKTGQGFREAEDIRQQMELLAKTFEERTSQGSREAEDIRQQLAPLLEESSRRHQSDRELLAEFDRLRESLAESLEEVSERLRGAVRG